MIEFLFTARLAQDFCQNKKKNKHQLNKPTNPPPKTQNLIIFVYIMQNTL